MFSFIHYYFPLCEKTHVHHLPARMGEPANHLTMEDTNVDAHQDFRDIAVKIEVV